MEARKRWRTEVYTMVERTIEARPNRGAASPSRIVRRREIARKVFLQIHRTIGLFVGAVFVLVGLSGSVLAFREDIDEWLNASIMRVDTPAQPSCRSLGRNSRAAIAAMPADGKAERLTMPRHAGLGGGDNLHGRDRRSRHRRLRDVRRSLHGEGQRPARFICMATRCSRSRLIPIVMAFHWTLLLGVNNAYILGSIGILVLHLHPRRSLSVVAAQWRLAAGLENQMGRKPGESRL